jgi:hypothetical protein
LTSIGVKEGKRGEGSHLNVQLKRIAVPKVRLRYPENFEI